MEEVPLMHCAVSSSAVVMLTYHHHQADSKIVDGVQSQ